MVLIFIVRVKEIRLIYKVIPYKIPQQLGGHLPPMDDIGGFYLEFIDHFSADPSGLKQVG